MSRVPRRRRSRATLRLVALAAAAGLAVAGCTASDDQSDGGVPLAGITEDEVTIGYVVVDSGTLQETLGFKQANYGDVATMSAGIQAVVDWVNQQGGAGGRTIKTEIVPLKAENSSPELVASICNRLTQDKRVFAAVLDGHYQDNALPCYYNANTLMLDQTVIAHDQAQFEQYAPYLWSPTLPEYGTYLKAHLQTLLDQGFFNGSKGVQLLVSGDEVSRRVAKQIAEPWVRQNVPGPMRVDYIDSTNQGTLGASSQLALSQGQSAGTNRVVTIGGARILPVALADYSAKTYQSTWSIGSYDNPAFVQDNPGALVTERRPGMVGLGFNPPADVSTDKEPAFPDPSNPAQQQCYDIISNAPGAAPPLRDGKITRENWRLALAYCDATMLIKQALDQIEGGEVTAQDFAKAVFAIGDAYRSALTFGSKWGEGIYAGTNVGRPLAWDEATKSFSYVGGPVVFEPPVAAAVEPTPASPDGSVPDGSVPAASTPAGSVPAVSTPAVPSQPAAPSQPAVQTPVG